MVIVLELAHQVNYYTVLCHIVNQEKIVIKISIASCINEN